MPSAIRGIQERPGIIFWAKPEIRTVVCVGEVGYQSKSNGLTTRTRE